MIRVNEVFTSIQGEGFHVGTPMVFCRLSGCNLNCDFCDTVHDAFIERDEESLAEDLYSLSASQGRIPICFTGGEPTLQIESLREVVAHIKHLIGIRIHIETNGTFGGELEKGLFDWVTVSPKGGLEEFNTWRMRTGAELKVVNIGQNLDIYEGVSTAFCEKFFQPCWSDNREEREKSIRDTITKVMNQGTGWKVSMQAHKYLEVR